MIGQLELPESWNDRSQIDRKLAGTIRKAGTT
jgi:hypothetical protein